jgi:hypothetical protein
VRRLIAYHTVGGISTGVVDAWLGELSGRSS